MQRLFICFCLLTCSLCMLAWDYPTLTFTTKDGTEHSVAVDELEIKFVDGKMMAVNSEDTIAIDISMLSKMAFSRQQTTAIDNVADDECEDIWNSTDVSVEVFSLTGVSMGKYSSMQQVCERLSAGIYLITVKGKTLKVVLR